MIRCKGRCWQSHSMRSALGQACAPGLHLQPALKRAEVHFPSAAPFILWLSRLSQEATAFPFWMSCCLFGRSYRFLQKTLSNLWCRVSAQTCFSLQLSLSALIYLLYGFPWNLLMSRSFYLQWGKRFGLAGETWQPSWSLTLNYFHSTEPAAQLEADTAKCTWAQPIFAIDSIKHCMALLNNPRQTWAQT